MGLAGLTKKTQLATTSITISTTAAHLLTPHCLLDGRSAVEVELEGLPEEAGTAVLRVPLQRALLALHT